MKKREYQTRKRTQARAESTQFCSFCGKGDDEVGNLIQADTSPVPCTVTLEIGGGYPPAVFQAAAEFTPYICDDCIALCADIIAENKEAEPVEAAPQEQTPKRRNA